MKLKLNLLMISILWDIMLCSPLKVNQHFGEKCRLHLKKIKVGLLLFLFILKK
jgi:hypothetical protein